MGEGYKVDQNISRDSSKGPVQIRYAQGLFFVESIQA